MTNGLDAPLTFLAALGSGLVAGIFFAFSAFIMTALVRVARQRTHAANPVRWLLARFLLSALARH